MAEENDQEGQSLPEGDEYPALGRAEWFAIVPRGMMAFRFGPFEGPAIGAIMSQCVEEGIPLHVTANCGVPFDWETARAMRGEGEPVPPFTEDQEARLAQLFADAGRQIPGPAGSSQIPS